MRPAAYRRILGIVAAAALGALALPGGAQAASRNWHGCGKAATQLAANLAGVPAALDADAGLARVFGDERPSVAYGSVYRAFCADFDGDGDLDRAAQYACCTVSSPSPVFILRSDVTTFAIAYKRLRAAIFRVRRSGRRLILREPKYSPNDANCCPSHYRDRTLRWTGTRFKVTTKIRRAPHAG
jgi:hypothetical protein